jgi:hypothetical protein
MSEPVLVPVEIPLVGDERLKNWAKVVDSVDESRSTGFAFGGYFISAGGIQDVPSGSVVIVYGEKGSRANPRPEARVYTVNADGTLSHEQSATGRAWARTIRDRVSDLLSGVSIGEDPELGWDHRLGRYATAALIEELERRGRRVES